MDPGLGAGELYLGNPRRKNRLATGRSREETLGGPFIKVSERKSFRSFRTKGSGE